MVSPYIQTFTSMTSQVLIHNFTSMTFDTNLKKALQEVVLKALEKSFANVVKVIDRTWSEIKYLAQNRVRLRITVEALFSTRKLQDPY